MLSFEPSEPVNLLNPYVVWYNKTDNSNYEESVEP